MSSDSVNEYETGASDIRPWGKWTVLSSRDGCVVKEIVVEPGQVLSLQSHEHRAEHWIVLEGTAEVTIDDSVIQRNSNEVVFIPAKSKHRIANIGDTKMRFVEVQTGEILSEADIKRYEDKYGRSS